MNVAYIRVSTVEQNEARQTEAMKDKDIDKFFKEKISAKDMNRPVLNEMLEYVREGDTVFVHDFSRLARSTKDLLNIVEMLKNKGVRLISNKENLDSHSATGKLMLTMIAAINEFERENLLERQREGIAIAKKEGKFTGRKRIVIDPHEFDINYLMYSQREITKTEFARRMNVSRPTLNKLLMDMH